MAPSESDIQFVIELGELSRAQAVSLLQKYSDAQQAVEALLDNREAALRPTPKPNPGWEHVDTLPAPGFRIDADDTLDIPPAPSRPPSRVDSRGNYDASGGQGQFGQQEDLDDETRKAIELSKQDFSAQESGVLPSGQHFGPANRPHYDSGRWELERLDSTIASAREIFDHPPPTKRRRLDDQPAFLRGSSSTGYLAPLINIYHSIPLAREAFCLRSLQLQSYGYDPAWWKGESDENKKSISIQVSQNHNFDDNNFMIELQTLMAFLDSTDRAYGSVDALADLRLLKNFPSDTPLSRLLEAWRATALKYDAQSPLSQIFSSVAIKDLHQRGGTDTKDLVCLEVPVDRRQSSDQSLIDLLDNTIWCDGVAEIDDVWMEHCAEVFTIRIFDPEHKGNGLGLTIPANWHPDRYMSYYREQSRAMRTELVGIRREINQCSQIQRRYELVSGPGDRIIRVREMLEAVTNLAGSMPKGPAGEAIEQGSMQSTENQALVAQLQEVMKRIDAKVQVLQERKTDLERTMKNISQRMTSPTSDFPAAPAMQYFLQGVSTKPSITYFRRKRSAPPNLIDLDDELERGETWQWWKVAWEDAPQDNPIYGPQLPTAAQVLSSEPVSSVGPYIISVVSEEEVLQAAQVEHDSVVLVYARQSAFGSSDWESSAFSADTDQPSTTVVPSLAVRKFIDLDNRHFRQEIIEEIGTPTNGLEEAPNSTMLDDGVPELKITHQDENEPREEEPPPYGLISEEHEPPPVMQQKKGNKIGLLADAMLDKCDEDAQQNQDGRPMHIEYSTQPLR